MMKKKIICLMMFCLFVLSNIAFATTWVFITRIIGDPSYNDYIDSSTVEKNNNILIYWNSGIFDTPASNGVKKFICKNEVNLNNNPIMWRALESYSYDSNNQEISRTLVPGVWFEAKIGGYAYQEINVASGYIKGSPNKPTLP